MKLMRTLATATALGTGLWLGWDILVPVVLSRVLASQLHLPVTLGAAQVNFFTGSIDLQNLTIGNPAPAGGIMLQVGRFYARSDPGKWFSTVITFQQVFIDLELLNLERSGSMLNVLQLVPVPAAPAAPGRPWLVQTLTLQLKQLRYLDPSGREQTVDLNVVQNFSQVTNLTQVTLPFAQAAASAGGAPLGALISSVLFSPAFASKVTAAFSRRIL